MNDRKFKCLTESDEDIFGSIYELFQNSNWVEKSNLMSLHESEKIILWRGSEGDLAADIGEFLSEKQIEELILELSSEYQKKKREKLRNEKL